MSAPAANSTPDDTFSQQLQINISTIIQILKGYDNFHPLLLKCLYAHKLVNEGTLAQDEDLQKTLKEKNQIFSWFINCFKLALETNSNLLLYMCIQANPKRISHIHTDMFDTQIPSYNDKHFRKFTLMVDDEKICEYCAGNGSMQNVNHKEQEFYLSTLKSPHDKVYSVQLKMDGRCIEVFSFKIKTKKGDMLSIINIHSRTGPLLASVVVPSENSSQYDIKINDSKTADINKFIPSPNISSPEYFTIINAVRNVQVPENSMMVFVGEGTKDNMRPMFDAKLSKDIKANESLFGLGKTPISAWFCHTATLKTFDGTTQMVFSMDELQKMKLPTCPVVQSPSGDQYWSFMDLNQSIFQGFASVMIDKEVKIPNLVIYAAQQLFKQEGPFAFKEHPIEGIVISCIMKNKKFTIKVKDPLFNDSLDG